MYFNYFFGHLWLIREISVHFLPVDSTGREGISFQHEGYPFLEIVRGTSVPIHYSCSGKHFWIFPPFNSR